MAERWAELRADVLAHLVSLPVDALDTIYDHPRRGTLTGREIMIVVARGYSDGTYKPTASVLKA